MYIARFTRVVVCVCHQHGWLALNRLSFLGRNRIVGRQSSLDFRRRAGTPLDDVMSDLWLLEGALLFVLVGGCSCSSCKLLLLLMQETLRVANTLALFFLL